MYTHSNYAKDLLGIGYELYYNGHWIAIVRVYDKKIYARPYTLFFGYAPNVYEFTTINDMFTAISMLKDICK